MTDPARIFGSPEKQLDALEVAVRELEVVAAPWPEAKAALLPAVSASQKRVKQRAQSSRAPINLNEIHSWKRNSAAINIHFISPAKIISFRLKTRLLRAWFTVIFIRQQLFRIALIGAAGGVALAVASNLTLIVDTLRRIVELP